MAAQRCQLRPCVQQQQQQQQQLARCSRPGAHVRLIWVAARHTTAPD
jgi:hypothetical protein